jgi:hypothetical protein
LQSASPTHLVLPLLHGTHALRKPKHSKSSLSPGPYNTPKVPLGGAPEEIASAAAALTVIELEAPVRDGWTVSVVVMVWAPAFSKAAEKFPTPLVSGELAGRCAWLSVLVNWTVPE